MKRRLNTVHMVERSDPFPAFLKFNSYATFIYFEVVFEFCDNTAERCSLIVIGLIGHVKLS